MAIFYMMCGLPGSGKSTYAKHLKGEIVSSDVMRETLFGTSLKMFTEEFISEEIKSYDTENLTSKELYLVKSKIASNKIFTLVDQLAIDLLSSGESVVYDATNLYRKYRVKTIEKVRPYADQIICIFMDTRIDDCIDRNANRENSVPVNVITRMKSAMEFPKYFEGFDQIYTIRSVYKGRKPNVRKDDI